MKMDELLPLKVYPFTLIQPGFSHTVQLVPVTHINPFAICNNYTEERLVFQLVAFRFHSKFLFATN